MTDAPIVVWNGPTTIDPSEVQLGPVYGIDTRPDHFLDGADGVGVLFRNDRLSTQQLREKLG